MNTKILGNIDWVGHVDWTIRDFHGYETARGATYNAYLIRDKKTTLIDTVKQPFAEELLENISRLTPLDSLRYVVCNHAEPDHAGAFGRLMGVVPHATVVCNKKCRRALGLHFDTSTWKFRIVTSGDTLSLGARTLEFFDTPMVHWPESMFTYVVQDKLLFSMDAFGQHYATSNRFDDQVQWCTALEEAKAYYANIVMPYGAQVAKSLDLAARLDIELIAPAHGVVWRRHVATILEAYRNWSVCRPSPKALVIYDSMWGSTEQMAEAIHDGASQAGIDAKLIHIRRSNLTQIATEVIDAATVAFGTSTLNRRMMPMAAATLTYLDGLRPVGKAAFAFGSYGWGSGGPEAVHEFFKSLKWEIIREPLRSKYRPTPEILDECCLWGRTLAQRAKEMAADL